MITNSGLKMMGFEAISPDEPVSARFHLLKVYGIQGITLSESELAGVAVFSGDGYRVAIGNSVNALSTSLLGDGFVDDEESWWAEHRLSPPFMMMHVGPTQRVTATDGFKQVKDGAFITHDTFPVPKQELLARERTALETVATAFSAVFSTTPHPVELRGTKAEVFGLTDDGQTVHDIRFRMSATAFVSSQVTASELATRMGKVVELQAQLSPDVSRFYFLGLDDADPLKRFTYCFLFIERYTNQTYKHLRKHPRLEAFFSVPGRLSETAARFALDLQGSANTLTQRFIWCAIAQWPNLADDDVATFALLKKERDRIAHGERITADGPLAAKARALAAKILLSQLDSKGVTVGATPDVS